MMKKVKMLSSVGIVLAFVFFVALLIFPARAEAKAEMVGIEGVNYNVGSSFKDNLESFVGKKVYLTLDSGKTFAGFVKKVGEHLIHLEKLDGKEFFDALIRIEHISTIDTRFRDFQR